METELKTPTDKDLVVKIDLDYENNLAPFYHPETFQRLNQVPFQKPMLDYFGNLVIKKKGLYVKEVLIKTIKRSPLVEGQNVQFLLRNPLLQRLFTTLLKKTPYATIKDISRLQASSNREHSSDPLLDESGAEEVDNG